MRDDSLVVRVPGPLRYGDGVDPVVKISGLRCVFRADDLTSLLPGKEEMKWSRLVLEKPA